MEDKENRKIIIEEVRETHPIYGIAAKIAFFCFVFFVFYGTKMPFRERATEVSEISTSNIVNQVAFTSIFLLACFALIPRIQQAVNFLLKEKILILFVLWALLSLAWSDFAFVGFKRWFQLLTALVTILAVFQYIKNVDDLLHFFTIQLSIFVIINLATIFSVPLAKDEHGEWRGIATSKNFLGQAALACSLIFVYAIKKAKSFWTRTWFWGMFIIATILVFGCASSTSLLTYCIIALVWFLYWVDAQFKKLEVGRVLTVVSLVAVITLAVSAVVIMPDRVNAALGLIGEDLTFTGRTDLWEDIMVEVKKHPVLGAGYQTFWVVDNPDLGRIYELYIWLPTQSHNGYLDIWNELGIIGLFLVFAMTAWFFIKKRELNYDYYWKWFLIAALIINFQESTLFRPGVLSGIMFMFAYLGLFKDLEYQENIQPYEEDEYAYGNVNEEYALAD